MGSLSENFNASCGCLYSKGKQGEIRSWRVSTEGGSIIVVHGRLNGVLQTVVKVAKGKNIGRANETTPTVQAILQAKSMYKKQIDKGYFPTIEEAESTLVILPMLAAKFTEKKHKIEYPCAVQVKLNGVRCNCRWEGDEIKLFSRGGKPYNVKHVSDSCKNYLPKGTGQVFDGELYVHGMDLQRINSLVKKPQPDSVLLEFHIYDTFSINKLEQPWIERYTDLKGYWSRFSTVSPLKEVLTVEANSEEEVLKFEEEFVKDSYEGAIVRDYRGVYTLSKRSTHLLKVKSFLDDEFEVIGFLEDVRGGVRFVCKTSDDKEFRVVPKGTLEQRREYLIRGNEYVGKWLTVKYFDFTPEGKPFHPVGICFRLEEDL